MNFQKKLSYLTEEVSMVRWVIMVTVTAFVTIIIVLVGCTRGAPPKPVNTFSNSNDQANGLPMTPEPRETPETKKPLTQSESGKETPQSEEQPPTQEPTVIPLVPSEGQGNISPALLREEPPIIPGSEVSIHVVDRQTSSPLTDVTFIISIEYEPPLDSNNFSYTMFVAGASPYRIPITVPGSPSRAVIKATKEGFLVSAELVITSDFYHEKINPLREGGVSEFLIEHTLTLKPKGVDSFF